MVKSNESHEILTITIVDENGSKQFIVSKYAKRIFAYCAVFLSCAVVAGYFIMSYMVKKLDSINQAKQLVYSEFQLVNEQNALLQDNIKNKTEKLQAIKEKIVDLESVMNIRNYTDEKIQKADLQKLAVTQKDTILQVLPSGNPLEEFDMKQKTKKKSYNTTLVSMDYTSQNTKNSGYDYYTKKREPVFATANGIVEAIRDDNQKHGYGNIIRLSHTLGFSTAYANLESIVVKKGEFVSKGDIIGYTTPSNNNSNISLYYEVRFLNDSLDTLSFIDWDIQNFKSIFESDSNSTVDLKSLIWALNDIVKLNEMSSHFAYDSIGNLITQVESKENNKIGMKTKLNKTSI